MVNQYPHTITVTRQVEATRDGSGNWIAGSSTETDLKGRYEPKSGNGFVLADDGSQINYDGIVYFPLPLTTLAPGTKVVVKNGAEVLLQSSVKRFNKGQLNARIWL